MTRLQPSRRFRPTLDLLPTRAVPAVCVMSSAVELPPPAPFAVSPMDPTSYDTTSPPVYNTSPMDPSTLNSPLIPTSN